MANFGKDLIAEKNRMESMKRSIIKYWNVNYIDNEVQKEQEELECEVQEVLERLEREKEEDEAEFREEIERAYHQAQLNDMARDQKNYNRLTKAYSGAYGQRDMDAATQDQVEMILNEKKAAFMDMINTEKAD